MRIRGFRGLLGEDGWRLLLRQGVERRYPARTVLMRQGDRGTDVVVLVTGRVKVLGVERDGGQALITLRGAGDLVGEVAARSAGGRTATVETLDRCTTRVIPAAAFGAFLDEHGGTSALLDYMAAKLSQTVRHQLDTVHHGPERRIARLLLEVVALADEAADPPTRVPFSQRDLALSLGLARSTVADHLRRLKEVGALRPGPRLDVVDMAALRHVAGM
ncbi:Crp/Fnr family transcriptional regulator [Saccharothrix violaceirubra]|uniref:CRP-like cAMP-binding protein n=1 Tax=Saccharothrix violaceirubra TaxID=413306 RepID=A0A7W7WVV4_9PSEU|nr:Crp/Fnr family transcriptional regulator [Saccharothrix violaceirubra]MBB4965720.1 CRP-like cAMP-binding protein [Saccharothrix violaceirubra]